MYKATDRKKLIEQRRVIDRSTVAAETSVLLSLLIGQVENN